MGGLHCSEDCLGSAKAHTTFLGLSPHSACGLRGLMRSWTPHCHNHSMVWALQRIQRLPQRSEHGLCALPLLLVCKGQGIGSAHGVAAWQWAGMQVQHGPWGAATVASWCTHKGRPVGMRRCCCVPMWQPPAGSPSPTAAPGPWALDSPDCPLVSSNALPAMENRLGAALPSPSELSQGHKAGTGHWALAFV